MLCTWRRGARYFGFRPLRQSPSIRWNAFLEQASLIIEAGVSTAMQSSRPRPLYLGFSSQKGGVGKSTLAEILSSMLYYEEGISLFVVDCDLTQDSFFKLRERERGL